MKLVKEHINEKFTEDSDPIEDLGIGLKVKLKQLLEKDLFLRIARPEQKDYLRIANIVAKARGNPEKEIMYAQNMANVITDHYKAYRRYLAAKDRGGDDWEVTNIFLKRTLELFKVI